MIPLKKISDFIKEDITRFLLIFFLIFQYSSLYRVAMRCIYEGAEFEWMQTWGVSLLGEDRAMRIMGNGIEGHYLLIILLAALFITVIFGLIRRSDDIFIKVLTLVFAGVLGAREWVLALTYGDQYQVVGETFGLELSYAVTGPLLGSIIILLAIVRLLENKSTGKVQPIRLLPVIWVGLIAVPCIILLRSGSQHGLTDIIGVNLIYLQFTLLLLYWIGLFSKSVRADSFK